MESCGQLELEVAEEYESLLQCVRADEIYSKLYALQRGDNSKKR